MCLVLTLTTAMAGWQSAAQEASPVDQAGSAVRVTLVDARTGVPVGDVLTKMSQDTGIYCAIAPCPSSSIELWAGRSDASGTVSLPKQHMTTDVDLRVSGYTSVFDIRDALRPGPDGGWVLDLLPTPSYPVGDDDGVPLQLVADTGTPIGEAVVEVMASSRRLILTTSPSGFVWIPFGPLFDADEVITVAAPGHQALRVDMTERPRRARLSRR